MFQFYISSAMYFSSLLRLVLLNVLLLARKWRMNGEVENVAEDKAPV